MDFTDSITANNMENKKALFELVDLVQKEGRPRTDPQGTPDLLLCSVLIGYE